MREWKSLPGWTVERFLLSVETCRPCTQGSDGFIESLMLTLIDTFHPLTNVNVFRSVFGWSLPCFSSRNRQKTWATHHRVQNVQCWEPRCCLHQSLNRSLQMHDTTCGEREMLYWWETLIERDQDNLNSMILAIVLHHTLCRSNHNSIADSKFLKRYFSKAEQIAEGYTRTLEEDFL